MPDYNPNHPWVVFALNDEEYCVNSASVQSIVPPEDMTRMPKNPVHLIGVMPLGKEHVPVVDARTLLGLESMAETIRDFGIMRQMHVNWVDALKDSVENRVPFTKAVDPHKCKFGRWYDSYHTDNISMNFILSKIEAPHAAIHGYGAKAQQLMAQGDWEGAQDVYRKAEKVCREDVLPLLDSLIDTYKEANRGMVLVLRDEDDTRVGLLVDQIERLAPGAKVSYAPLPAGLGGDGGFIADMVLEDDHTLSNLDVAQFFAFVGSHAAEVESALALARSRDE